MLEEALNHPVRLHWAVSPALHPKVPPGLVPHLGMLQPSLGMGHTEPGWGCMWGVGALMALGACDGGLSSGDTLCVTGVCVHRA